MSRKSPCCRRPHRLGQVADVETARLERPVLEHRERPESGSEGCHRGREDASGLRHRASSDSSNPRHCAPSTSSLARVAYVARPASPIRLASPRSPDSRLIAAASAVASAGGTRIALSPSLRSSRAAGVSPVMSGVPQASLKRLVGNDTGRLLRGAEDAERAPGHLDRARQVARIRSTGSSDVGGPRLEQVVELAGADDPERKVRQQPRCAENRLQPVQRDQLADEEHLESAAAGASPAGRRRPPRRPDRRRFGLGGHRSAPRRIARAARCRRRRGRRGGRRCGRFA